MSAAYHGDEHYDYNDSNNSHANGTQRENSAAAGHWAANANNTRHPPSAEVTSLGGSVLILWYLCSVNSGLSQELVEPLSW